MGRDGVGWQLTRPDGALMAMQVLHPMCMHSCAFTMPCSHCLALLQVSAAVGRG